MLFCVVYFEKNKEIARSESMDFEKALDKVRKLHKIGEKSYVEEARSVKHLSLIEPRQT